MKPVPFQLFTPSTVDECVSLLAEYGDDAKLLAGGQSLIPMMNLRLAAPEILIDLNGVNELRYIEDDGEHLTIGAMTRHRDLVYSGTVRAACPLLSDAAPLIGYRAIRNRGTFGGSVAHADPASELPCIAVTLDAEFTIAGADGRRTVAAADFFVSHFTTVLEPAEILLEARFPRRTEGDGWQFVEFARKSGDFAVAAVAVDLPLVGGDARARVGVAGIGERPWRATEAETILSSGEPMEELVRDAARSAGEQALAVVGDHADGAYRAHVLETLTSRAVSGAAAKRTERDG